MKIARRERVTDIRAVWPKESHFSDWLVSEDGVTFLSEELDVEIENLERESRPGDYPCDIVGNLLGDENHIVVIENQYGKTNHDHLGKLLTYAAVHKAMTGIWIAERISDDHRQVIDWLNENTPTNVNLYAVALKLYRIGDSPVAPQLDVVCRPNTMVKETKSGYTQSDLERHAWRRSMWEKIHEAVRASNPPFRLQKPSDNHWSSIGIGRSGFHLSMLLTPKNESIAVALMINAPWKDDAFHQLLARRNEIEQDLNASLDWRLLPDKKISRIQLEVKIDPKIGENEAQVKEWFVRWTREMYRVFKDRVRNLAPTEHSDEDDQLGE